MKLKVEAGAGAEFAAKIDAQMAESLTEANDEQKLAAAQAKKEGKSVPKKPKSADPPYQIEEDGSFVFSFKMTASGKRTKDGSTWTASPAIFDAQGKPAVALRIGGGSALVISFEFYRFYTALIGAGVSLRMAAVQVLELVEWGRRDAEGFGFAQEEGFSVETTEAAEEEAVKETAESADDFEF